MTSLAEKKTPETKPKEKLWNLNFFLFSQGHFISALGDQAYNIALGFWILAVTGSTGLMGVLMAAANLPRVIIAPFAGTIVDRSDRKKILVMMDMIRGIAVLFIAFAAYQGFITLWMVFTAGILMGVCDSFFNPAISATIPDIVPKTKLVKAYSARNLLTNISFIIGKSGGGLIYQTLGAPLLFLVNGISFIYSGFSEAFVNIPKVEKNVKKVSFFEDMKEGITFINNFKGLKYAFIAISLVNFLNGMIAVLTIPFFEKMSYLGPAKYGVAMAASSAGSFLGYLCLSMITIKNNRKAGLFHGSGILTSLLMMTYLFVHNIYAISALFVLIGLLGAIVPTFFISGTQLVIPQNMRGKVSGFLGALAGALYPLAMMTGGLLAEFIPALRIILVSSGFLACVYGVLYFNRPLTKFLNFDPEKQAVEDIM